MLAPRDFSGNAISWVARFFADFSIKSPRAGPSFSGCFIYLFPGRRDRPLALATARIDPAMGGVFGESRFEMKSVPASSGRSRSLVQWHAAHPLAADADGKGRTRVHPPTERLGRRRLNHRPGALERPVRT